MILTCPACATRYSADPASLGPTGRMVRCVKCNRSWMQLPPDDMPRLLEVPVAPLAIAEYPPVRRSALLRHGGAALLLGAILVVAAGGYFGRAWVAQRWPALKPYYELAGLATDPVGAGLAINSVVFTRQVGTDNALVVQGNVTNRTDRPQQVPLLRAILSNDSDKTLLQWDFSLDKPSLLPGETEPFRTSVKNPPLMFRKLSITFVGR